MSNVQREESGPSRINGLTAIGGIAVLLAFVPTFTGGAVHALYLLAGILLIVGGLIVHAIKSRP